MLDLSPCHQVIYCCFIVRVDIVHTMLRRHPISFLQRHTEGLNESGHSLLSLSFENCKVEVLVCWWETGTGPACSLQTSNPMSGQIICSLAAQDPFFYLTSHGLEKNEHEHVSHSHNCSDEGFVVRTPIYFHFELLVFFMSVHLFPHMCSGYLP